jgi:hypothetical protein
MAQPTDSANVCCVALELSKKSWVIAFSPPPDGGKNSLHQIAAKDISRLLSFLESARLKAEREACVCQYSLASMIVSTRVTMGSLLCITAIQSVGKGAPQLSRTVRNDACSVPFTTSHRAHATGSISSLMASSTAWASGALGAVLNIIAFTRARVRGFTGQVPQVPRTACPMANGLREICPDAAPSLDRTPGDEVDPTKLN